VTPTKEQNAVAYFLKKNNATVHINFTKKIKTKTIHLQGHANTGIKIQNS